jgi:hypothetical protein
MKRLIFSLVFMLLFFVSCCEKKEKKSDYFIVDLEKAISATNWEMKSLNDISSEYRLFPFETNDSCLLSSCRIKEVSDSDIWVSDKDVIYQFDRQTGKLLFKLDRKGQGAEEYISILDFAVDTKLKILFVYDLHKQKIIKYDFRGIFLGYIDNNFIGSLGLIDDNFVVSYSPFSDIPFHIGIYDKNWNVVQQFIHRNMEINQKDIINFDMLSKFNGQYFLKTAFADTVYKINKESFERYLIVSAGNLKPPIETLTVLSKQNKQKRHQYISREYGKIISKYYFSQYYFQMKVYQDIWDLSKCSLVYRNLRTSPESKNGFPFVLDDKKTIYVEPEFVSDNCLYGIVPVEELQDIVPNVKDDDNPFIIEIKIN